MATGSPPMARLLTSRFLTRRGAVRVPDRGAGRGWRGTKGRPGGQRLEGGRRRLRVGDDDLRPHRQPQQVDRRRLTCSPFTSLATAPAGINYKLYTVDLEIATAWLPRRGLAG